MPQSSVSTAGAILPRLRNRLRRRVLLQLLRRPPQASSQLVPQPRLLGLVSGNKRFIGLGLVVVGLIAGWLGADAEGPGGGGLLLPVGVVVLLTGRWYLRGLVAFFSFAIAFAPLFPDFEPSSTSVPQESPTDNRSTVPAPARTTQVAPANDRTALQQMEIAFVGNPRRSVIKAQIDEAMSLYSTPITEENYSRAGSALVELRREMGPSEMDILDYMIRSHVPGANMDFPSAAAMSATFLALGER